MFGHSMSFGGDSAEFEIQEQEEHAGSIDSDQEHLIDRNSTRVKASKTV